MCVSLAALLAAACADLPETTEVPDPQEPRYMTFDISDIDTKVSDSEDLKSYEFSIWIYESEKKTDPLVDGDNVKLRYDSASGRWRFHDGSSFIDVPWGDGNHDFFVVSSYDLAGTLQKISFDKSVTGYMPSYRNDMAKFSIPTMNMTYYSDGSDYNYYKDILYAAASRDVSTEDGYKPVSLTLGHLWPALEFNMINETNQNKYITDFSVSNFDVEFDGFSFSASSGYNYELVNYTGVAENKYEVEDFVLPPGKQRSVFGMPVMVFPQKFESDEKSAILSFSVDGVKTTKKFYVDAPDGLSTQEWNPGRLYSYDIRLKTPAEPVVISPKVVSIEHFKDANDVLTHSALNLDLNLDDAQLSRVKNLRVVVSKGGVDYLDQTFATVSSNEMTLYKGSASDPGRFYMPKGTGYQVTLTYNDGFYDQTVTCEAITSPTPDYTLTVNVSATSNQFTVNSMSVNIADRVLAECPLKGHSSYSHVLRVTGSNYLYIYTSDSGVSLTSSTFVSNVTFSNCSPSSSGYYTIVPYVKFDDVVKEAGNCNVVTSNKYSGQYIYPDEVRYSTVSLSPITNSEALEDGAMYVIRANWNSSLYWSVNTSNSGQLVSGSSQTSFPKEYVFVYDRDDSKEVVGGLFKDTNPSNYKLESVGAWKSLATGDYMVYKNGVFYFNESSASSAQYVVCANGWDTYNTSADIDMCVDATRMIVYTNNAFTLGTNSTPNQQWKWNIFKVEEE